MAENPYLQALDAEPEQPRENPYLALVGDDGPDFDVEIQSAFRAAFAGQPERKASIEALARATGISAGLVEQNYDGFFASHKAGLEDPKRWREENPALAKLVRENRRVAEVAIRDEKLSWLTKFLRAWDKLDAHGDDVASQGPSMPGASPEEMRADLFAAAREVEAGRATLPTPPTMGELAPPPGQVPMVTDPSVGQGLGAKAAATYRQAAKRDDYAKLGGEILARKKLGLDTWELEKRAVDMERELLPIYVGEVGAVGQVVLDSANILPSIVETYRAAGVGGLAGAALGAIPGAAARNPALAKKGAMLGLGLGARAGTFASSLSREAGGAFLEMRQETTDDGRPVDEDVAIGASVLYGGAAALVEVATFGVGASMWGPLGDAVAKGTGKAFLKGLLKDAGARAILKDIGKRWMKGAGAETGEEVAQEWLGMVSSYLARSATQGKFQDVDLGAARDRLVETAVTTFRGTMGLAPGMAATNVGTQIVGARLAMEASSRGADKAKAIMEAAKDSPTAKASPQSMADLIAQESARSGEPVTSLFVDPSAIVRYFQDNNEDPDRAIADMLGEGGVDRVRESLQTGGLVEVPMPEYLDTIAQHPINDALVEDVAVEPGRETRRQLSARDPKAVEQQVNELVDAWEKGAAPPATEAESAYADALEAQLAQVPGHTPEGAAKQVLLHRAFIRTQAAEFGVSPDELLEFDRAQVRRDGEAAPAAVVPVRRPQTQEAQAQEPPAPEMSEFPAASLELAQRLEGETRLQAEELASERYVDPVSGLRDRAMWDATERQPGKMIAVLTSPEVKGINDDPTAGGHDKANEFLRAVGRVLFGVDSEAARSGTNFLFQVADEGEPKAAVAKVKAALPDQRFSVEAVASQSQHEAFRLLDEAVEGKRGKGELPARGKLPEGLDLGVLDFGEGMASATVPDWLVQEVGEMDPQAYFEATYLDRPAPTGADPEPEPTGLLSARGWRALRRRKHVLAKDLKGLKEANDKYGKAVGNHMLAAFSREAVALGGSEVNAAHLSGDEFAADHDDQLTLVAFAESLTERLKEITIKARNLKTGEIEDVSIQFRYGIAEGSYGAADLALNRAKAEGQDRGGVGASLLEERGADLRERAEAIKRAARPQAFPRRPSQGGGPQSGGNRDGSGGPPATRGPGELPEGSRGGDSPDASGVGPERAVEPLSPEALAQAKTKIAAMRKPENRAMAEAWLEYTQAPDWRERQRPQVTPDVEKLLARFGAVDPEGFAYGEDGRSLERPVPGRRGAGGVEPEELRRQRLERGMSIEEWQEAGYKTFYQSEKKPPGGSDPRGYTRIIPAGAGRLFDVVLGRKANLSTFLHESGHIFLELMSDLAARPDAPARLRNDWAGTLKWMGTDEAAWAGMSADEKRPFHEKWARTFEGYLFEGKAPSEELTGAFTRFRLWLREVYKSLASIGAELDDEIRGIFDRMLATDEEIERTQKAMGLKPLFRTPEEAGMRPEEFQAYLQSMERATSAATLRATHKVLKERLRETEAWWKEEEAALREEASSEYDRLPASRATHYLRTGELKDESGETVLTGERPKMDPGDVAFVLGKRPEGMKAFLRKGGRHPDDVAEALGYGTGRQMLEDMERRPEKSKWVEETARARMLAKHPGLMEDLEKLQAEVGKGLHGEHSAAWLLREWMALRAKAGQGAAPVESVERAAEMLVSRRPVGALHLGRALQAERSASEKAFRATAKGNWQQAHVFKQQQLLNHFMYRHLAEAVEGRDSFEALAASLRKDKTRARVGKASPVYRDAIDSILEALDLKQPEAREAPPAGLAELAATLEANGETVAFEVDFIGGLLARPRPWKQLAVAEMRAVHGALKNIKQAATNRNTALVDGKRMEKAQVVAELVAEAAANLPDRGPLPSSEAAMTLVQKGLALTSAFDGDLLRPETMLGWLGAAKGFDSMWHRALLKPLLDARVREADLLRKTAKPIMEAFEKVPKEVRKRFAEKVDGAKLFPGHRADVAAPTRRFELLVMAMNSGNASNLQRLLEGRNITQAELQAALELLTKEEMDWVQSILDAMESLWPEARALEERDSGLAPEKIEATPIVTSKGKWRGGYFPAVYDRRVSATGERQAADAVAALLDPSYTRPGTRHSHLKGRARDFADVIALDTSTIQAHLAQATHDIAFREAVKSVGGLLMNNDIRAAMRNHLGEGRAGVFLQWVKDVGQMRGAEVASHARGFSRMLRTGKANLAIATLGYAADIAIGDLSNPIVAVLGTDLKAKHMTAGLAEFARHPIRAREFALEKSGELRIRDDFLLKEFGGQMKKLASRRGPARDALDVFREEAFTIFEWMERATLTPMWLGAYRQALAEGAADARAVEFADSIVRRTAPAASAVDKSAVLRDKGIVGGLMLFHGYMNTILNLGRDAAEPLFVALREGDNVMEKAAGVARVSPRAAARTMGVLLAFGVFGEWLNGKGREEGEEHWEWVLRKLLTSAAATIPFASSAVESLVAAGGKAPSSRAAPGIAFIDDTIRAIQKALDENRGDWEKVVSILRAAGAAGGYPAARPARAADYIADVLAGEKSPANPVEAFGGVVYGSREDQPANPASFVNELLSGGP
jgi:GGDEF domain-containing protein